jgi:hypothetical protein
MSVTISPESNSILPLILRKYFFGGNKSLRQNPTQILLITSFLSSDLLKVRNFKVDDWFLGLG